MGEISSWIFHNWIFYAVWIIIGNLFLMHSANQFHIEPCFSNSTNVCINQVSDYSSMDFTSKLAIFAYAFILCFLAFYSYKRVRLSSLKKLKK